MLLQAMAYNKHTQLTGNPRSQEQKGSVEERRGSMFEFPLDALADFP